MRLVLIFSSNKQTVPFSYQHDLTGVFHRLIGKNPLHDDVSLYSLSWLTGGKRDGDGLSFPQGATWFISAHNPAILQKICSTALLLNNTEIYCGMRILEIKIIPPPRTQKCHRFKVASPVLARSKKAEGKVQHYIFSDKEADAVLTQTLHHKLDKAGLGHLSAGTQVQFDRSYSKAHTKLVTINGIANRASVCPIIIKGSPEVIEFAWNVGIGHLTGSGFGALI